MTMWGGRFELPPAADLWSYTVDPADRRLLAVDVEGSLAHVAMLARVGLLADGERAALETGLHQILADARDGTFEFLPTDEDVHSAVERRLGELVGEVAGKLHTGRSRNDQVALDLRLYLRGAVDDRLADLEGLVAVLVDRAEEHKATVIPAYTHLQQAQATTLGQHLLAHVWMLRRDRERLSDLRRRLRESPLGAGAVAGSTLPLDPAFTAELLGFAGPFHNSIEAVASRDLAAEFTFCAAQLMVGLSRLAEETVLWATSEFGWASFTDDYTTGSSALPQKKNPDIAELARGRAAAAIGAVTAMLALQKGLPLAYNRDLQEDKPAVFAADDLLAGTLPALAGMLRTASFHPPPPGDWTSALALAERLVVRGVPFRQAHVAVGRLVGALERSGRTFTGATLADLRAAGDRFDESDVEFLASGSEQAAVAAVADVERQLVLLRTPPAG
jgi:argininosuccinate lyase